jgi:OOP family OmpA-OmpF porin
MTKSYLKGLFLLMISALLFSCAAGQVQTTQSRFSPDTLEVDQYEPKVDNFMVILDKSSSMSWKYNGQKQLNIAKDFLSAMNQTIPDMKLNGALRTFGHMASASGKPTVLFYGPTEYSSKGFQGALNAVERAIGRSPLAPAINAAGGDLKKSEGQIAVIIVSDGEDMDATPITAAKNMKAKFGDRLCIYTVLVGDDPAGETLMKQVAAAGGCGFSVRADGFKDSGDMGDFVKNVFLTEVAKPVDSDGDGVTDDLDRCPDTPTGVKVDAQGCPIDTDGDGVYDYLDKCPGTPENAKVNAQGCWILGGILFDTNKSDIKPNFYPDLDAVVAVLEKNTALNIKIKGHTDNIGMAAYNLKLSESRAKAVMDYLVEKGIDPKRLSAKGFGLTLPIVGNDTKEGRAKNRRVELQPMQ